ncbi:hypothetical protein F4825DRAFT_477425 [Nemania diffusa]|nr:hypothetical protein F4825DRAFT_477425 [Nemania diffusa]
MADRFRLDLKTFEISTDSFNVSLSMTSVAFIYNVPLRDITQEDLSSLIRSKQLWLLPRGLCRLDIRVQLDECDIIWREEQDGFFEFIADVICQSALWLQLGLRVEILDIQYHREEGNTPNLYFSIEQPDMSSALLSPPHINTAHLKGLECILRFKSPSRLEAGCIGEEQLDPNVVSLGQMNSSSGIPSDHYTFNIPNLAEMWEHAAYLAETALCITFGTRKRMQGLTIYELDKGPSLLDLAPAIWNSRYLKSTVGHAKNFAVISNILASSLNGQSPELRRKGAEILKCNAEVSIDPNREPEYSIKQLESSIQRMLWGLLQDTLKSTIGTSDAARKPASINHEYDESDEIMIDGEIVDQYGLSDGYPYPCEDMSLSSTQSYNDPSYKSDLEFTLEDETEDLYYDASISGCQFPESYLQQSKSDLCHEIQDHVMSEYGYDENHDIYSYEYDYTGLKEQGFTGYELAATTMISRFEKQGGDNTIRGGGAEEGSSNLEVGEEGLL